MPSSNQVGEVLARVEGATGPDRGLDCWIMGKLDDELAPWSDADCEYAASDAARTCGAQPYTASIDAALALVERKLPGWGCASLSWHTGGKSPVFRIERSHPTNIEVAAEGHTRPLAILAALLRALASQETDRGNG